MVRNSSFGGGGLGHEDVGTRGHESVPCHSSEIKVSDCEERVERDDASGGQRMTVLGFQEDLECFHDHLNEHLSGGGS